MKQNYQYRPIFGGGMNGAGMNGGADTGANCPWNAPQTPQTAGTVPSSPLAIIYSPEQRFTDIYEPEEALSRGSLFSDLVFPFDVCSGGVR